MPTYDYACQDCEAPFALRISMARYAEGVTATCPRCGSSNAARRFAPVNVLTGSRGNGGSCAAAECGTSGFS